MNNKGFLLAEETIKIIIALICLTFLAYLLFSIYSNNKNNKDLEFAEASLEYLIERFNSGENSAEIYNPEGWYVLNQPEGKLCICEGKSFNMGPKDCAEFGVCVNSKFEIENGPIEIKNPPVVIIRK